MANGPLQEEVLKTYEADGFVIARGMFSGEEIGLLRRAAKEDRELDQHSFGRGDGEGGTVRLSLWNHPGDTIYGMFARCESIVNSAEKILGGEVYHYHSKMIMKDARVGGAWAWHQDYGYWYQNGVLFPLLTSVFIAVDPATRENGCMQVIERVAPSGPHRPRAHRRPGRRGHGAGARGREACLQLVYVEMEPGDVLFFHCQPAAPLRPEQLREPALVDDLLLQRRAQRSLQGAPPSALHAAEQGARLGHSRGRHAALQRQWQRRGLDEDRRRQERIEPGGLGRAAHRAVSQIIIREICSPAIRSVIPSRPGAGPDPC